MLHFILQQSKTKNLDQNQSSVFVTAFFCYNNTR